jgi:hypothetical protein
MTGLSPRTVKSALAALIDRKLVSRAGRYRRLVVHLDTGVERPMGADFSASVGAAAAGPGGASLLAPPDGKAGGASLVAPRRGKLSCTSPTTISFLSSRRKRSSRPGGFTPRQEVVIADVLAESSELLGKEAGGLPLPAEVAERLGMASKTTYAEARAAIAREGDPFKAHDFTRAVLGLRRDLRIQGRELRIAAGAS